MTETCTNCGNDVDKEPTVLCDECDGSDDLRRRRLEAKLAEVTSERGRLRTMGEKVNEIRKSIVGMQGFNFSEHAYPLVAALNEAGFDGGTYELNRKNLGTLIEQVKAAETALAAAQAHVAELRALLESVKEHGVIVNDAAVNAALVRESSTEALREFGLKVATAIIDRIGQVIDRRAVVDAVLRGES